MEKKKQVSMRFDEGSMKYIDFMGEQFGKKSTAEIIRCSLGLMHYLMTKCPEKLVIITENDEELHIPYKVMPI